jgi:glycosyltransferase involved in cell wall biosynthesis
MLVSVIIPVFNGAATVAAAIDSALAQKFAGEFEVVVVNDGSTDTTAEVLARYGDRIRVVTQENRGLAAARNAGVANSTGEYLAFLDADDVWREDKLTKTAGLFESVSGCVLVFHDALVVDSAGQVLKDRLVSTESAHAPLLAEMLQRVWEIQPSTVVMRRAVLERIGGFPEEFGRRGYGGEDAYTFLLARECGAFGYVPEQLSSYKISGLSDNLVKRIGSLAAANDPAKLGAALTECVAGYGVFARLIREHFGARGKRLIRDSVATQAGGLVAIGLYAAHKSDFALARRCYLMSFEYVSWAPKTWLRLLWTFLPEPVARLVIGYLPIRARRAFAGPPFDALEGARMP